MHADDLATALSKLHARGHALPEDMEIDQPEPNRARSSSITVVYHPKQHGSNPNLPAISVEDTEFAESPVGSDGGIDGQNGQIMHTARPPVELME